MEPARGWRSHYSWRYDLNNSAAETPRPQAPGRPTQVGPLASARAPEFGKTVKLVNGGKPKNQTAARGRGCGPRIHCWAPAFRLDCQCGMPLPDSGGASGECFREPFPADCSAHRHEMKGDTRMVRAFTIAVVEAKDGTGGVLQIANPHGGMGTPVFETIESAQAYVDQLEEPDSWSVRGIQGVNAVLWLKSLRKNGVAFVVREPAVGEAPFDDEFETVGSFVTNVAYRAS